jgi:hypothetical protein
MPGSAIDLAQNPFALLSLIAAPAVLTNAASVLALTGRKSEGKRGSRLFW